MLCKMLLQLTSIHKHQKSTTVNPSYIQGAFTLYVLSLLEDLSGSQSRCAMLEELQTASVQEPQAFWRTEAAAKEVS